MAGLRPYAAIDQTVILTQIMRQQDNSPEVVQFRNVLKELRQGPISPSSWQSLVRRTKDNLSPAEWESFHDALRLYATNREVYRYNLQHLESLNRPVMNVKAVNTGPSQEGAGNLENKLLLSAGAKVMLLWNLCLDEGVVNGTRATVHSLFGTTTFKTLSTPCPRWFLSRSMAMQDGRVFQSMGSSSFLYYLERSNETTMRAYAAAGKFR